MKRKILVPFPALVLTLLLTSFALAQSGGAYDLTWNTWDGGGGMFSTGGTYSLGGTIGQPDAGALNGGAYSLNGGFWYAESSAPTAVNLVSFRARAADPSVKLKWVTSSEFHTAGYNVWRSATGAAGEYARVNSELITPIYPGADGLTKHSFTDTPGVGEYYYKLEIAKEDQASEWSSPARVQLGAACARPDKPALISPNDSTSSKKARVKLKWETAACATYYQLVVRRESPKGHVSVRENNLSVTEFKTNKLNRGKTYYWQVRACNANNCAKSAWQSFEVRAQ